MLYIFDDRGDAKKGLHLRVVDPERFAQTGGANKVGAGEANSVMQVVLKTIGAIPDFSSIPVLPQQPASTTIQKTVEIPVTPVAAPVATPVAAPAAVVATTAPAAPAPAATPTPATTAGPIDVARALTLNDFRRPDGKKAPRPELKDLALELGCTGVSTATALPALKEKITEAVNNVGAPAPAAAPPAATAPVAATPAPVAAAAPVSVPAVPTGPVPTPPNPNATAVMPPQAAAPVAAPVAAAVPVVPQAAYPAPTAPAPTAPPVVPQAAAPGGTVVPANNAWAGPAPVAAAPVAAAPVAAPADLPPYPGAPKSAEDVDSRDLRFDEAASEISRNGGVPDGFVVRDQWNMEITVPLFVWQQPGKMKPIAGVPEWLAKYIK